MAQMFTSTQEARQAALAQGFTQWFNGTSWSPMMSVQSNNAFHKAWLDVEHKTLGALSSDGARFGWHIR